MRRMRRSGEPARRDRTRLSQGGVLAPGGSRCLGGGCVHGYTPGPGPPAVTARVAACGLLRHPISLHLGVPDGKLLSPAGALPSRLVWGGADAHPGLGSAFPVAPFHGLGRVSCRHGVEASVRPCCGPWPPACCRAAETHLSPRGWPTRPHGQPLTVCGPSRTTGCSRPE